MQVKCANEGHRGAWQVRVPSNFFFGRDAIDLQLSIDHSSCLASFATLQVRSTMDGPNVFESRLDVRVCKSQPIVIPNPAIPGDNLGGEVLVSIIH